MPRIQFSSGGGGGGGVDQFILLTDTPAAYAVGTRGYLVAQNNTDNGVEFIDPTTVGTTTFLGLSDTPSSYGVGTSGFLVAQNVANTAVEFIDPTSLNSSFTFTGLSDTPSSYSAGTRGFLVAQNATDTAVEFIDPATVGATTFLGLSDTPGSYSGSGSQIVQVNGGGTGLIFASGMKGSLIGEKIDFITRQTAYGSTGDHEGELLKIGAGSQTQGNVLYWDGSDWADADASAAATASGLITIAHTTGSPSSNGALQKGLIQLAAAPGTAGDVLYLSETAGGLTATAPTTSGAIVRVIGYDVDGAGLIYFNPSQDWLEIV